MPAIRFRRPALRRMRTLLPPLFLLASACEPSQPIAPGLGSASLSTSGDQVIQGETGPGALYEIHVPAAWNGDVVLYAHGIRNPREPLSLRDQDNFKAFRDRVVADGYAFAYSSYSENGVAFKDAAQRTHQLRGIFASRVADPDRVYLAGHSLGGVVTLMLAERYPAQYAGALTMCGQVGGVQRTIDYFAHIRVLFDYFYPGVVPGDAMNIPQDVDLLATRDAAIAAIVANPMGAGAIARIMAGLGTPVPAVSSATLVESILTAVMFGLQYVPDLADRTHGHSPFDNSATLYGTPALPPEMIAHLNANVDRFTATPDARNYVRKYYEPTGQLQVPVLTLANRLDPVSAPFHEPTYGATVANAGRGHLLQQRIGGAPFGHCVFSVDEMTAAFHHLVGWVEG